MIEITALRKRYDGFAFGPVDLRVGREVLSVLGPSGCGKTTLLSLVAGTVDPDGGSVSLDGRSLDGRPPHRRGVGVVFQDGALFPHMTARENVAYGASDPERVDDLAARFEIADVLDRRPAALSGGEAQRVALARTLAADPDALLLDEPLSSLDAPIRRRLREELRSLFASLDIPVIYVTHDQRTATALGDRTAVFRDGALEQIGPAGDVVARPATRFVARFTGNENVFTATVVDRDDDGSTLRVGDVTLRTAATDLPSDEVTVCVHPSRLGLDRAAVPVEHDGGSSTVGTDAEEPAADAEVDTAIHGHVERCLDEGEQVRVAVAVDDAPIELVATVRPPTFERAVRDGDGRVRVTVPPASLHVIGPTD